MPAKERTNALIVGAPRQGKSHYIENRMIEYARAGGCSVVYNAGKPSDFSRFLQVKILTVSDMVAIWEAQNRKRATYADTPKEISFFQFAGKTYHISAFSKMFAGKCVKVERINDSRFRSEDFFFEAVYRYFYNTFFCVDDCRTIFRKGFQSEICGLLSRVNHAGKMACKNPEILGVDTALIYHGFNTVNREAYQFINLLVQFKTSSTPTVPPEADEFEGVILDNYSALNSAQKYSHFEFYRWENENIFFKP